MNTTQHHRRGLLIVLGRLTAISVILYFATGLFYDRLLTGLAIAADKPAPRPPVTTPPPAPTPAGAAETGIDPDLRLILERNIFQGGGRPGPRAEAGDNSLALLGTVVGTERRAVLRHGQGQGLFREGDNVAGARIVRIERNQVTVQRQGREEILLVEARRGDAPPGLRGVETVSAPEDGDTVQTESPPLPQPGPRPAAEAAARTPVPRTAVKADPLLSPAPAPAIPAQPRPAPVGEKTTP
ncbi:MAG: hypothetical protein BWK76_01680 [Desulfobulbaceae bacterium A2]|nr:MAG: hypothetical protein BWK76_01680 [Desulfobulbaceae bacterium A2]